jgi:hypothetical protein
MQCSGNAERETVVDVRLPDDSVVGGPRRIRFPRAYIHILNPPVRLPDSQDCLLWIMGFSNRVNGVFS